MTQAFTWLRSSITKDILSSIVPTDLTIVEVGLPGEETLAWDMEGDPRIEDLRRIQAREIDDIVGYPLTKEMSLQQHQRWMEVATAVPTIQDALNSRFGDPNILFKGLSLRQAKSRWENAGNSAL